jgi:HKD family nuclease
MEDLLSQLKHSLQKGFIDKKHSEFSRFKPELLVNQKDKRQDVLTSLTDELKTCRTFMFSVAFVTESGLATLKSHLLDLHEKGVEGKDFNLHVSIF